MQFNTRERTAIRIFFTGYILTVTSWYAAIVLHVGWWGR